jgi:hypothetical protein
MPANTVDLEAYFTFLFRCAEDPRFNADTLMAAIKAGTKRAVGNQSPEKAVGPIEGLILRRSVAQLRETLLTRRRQLGYIALLSEDPTRYQALRFGPGRVDTFSPYKSIQFGFPHDGTFGVADYPSIWNQRPREGMHLHWDGNNKSVFERNISASLGAGATPVTLDMHRMVRVANWIGSPPPPNVEFGGPERADVNAQGGKSPPVPRHGELPIPNYPFPLDSVSVNRGRRLYEQHCLDCHGWEHTERVIEIGDIGTDPARLDSYTESVQANQNLLGAGLWWRFRNFRKTSGYASMPLDGVWARAPYLHNGSVPTLYDLLNKPCTPADLPQLGITSATDLVELAEEPQKVKQIIDQARAQGLRPPVFYRGDDAYDQIHGGFQCDRSRSADGRVLFLFTTFAVHDGRLVSLLGNGHGGHYGETKSGKKGRYTYGRFSPQDKRDLVAYQLSIGGRQGGAAQ